MAATRPHGPARKRSAAASPITFPPVIPRPATLATLPPLGWAQHSTILTSRFRITVRFATTATRFPPTTRASLASTATLPPRTRSPAPTIPTRTSPAIVTAPPSATTATRTGALTDMRARSAFYMAIVCFSALFLTFFSRGVSAQTDSSGHNSAVFHVRYIAETSVYLDAGRNAGIQEGMKLSVVAPPPDAVASDGVRFRGYPHIAELNVISVADSSSVCDVISAPGELKVGELAFLTPNSIEDRQLAESARDAENYP